MLGDTGRPSGFLTIERALSMGLEELVKLCGGAHHFFLLRRTHSASVGVEQSRCSSMVVPIALMINRFFLVVLPGPLLASVILVCKRIIESRAT